uniref:Kininogen-2 n=1 Tax=Bombina maxima TaxID=161274 RepID=BRK2_BOMMX|nr:RecName: Full=Kininogen-2; AltName: Full=BMK-2; Contains: RecName: Full=Maximakinin; Contains: RecName: Full=Bradykinin; Contains: RecName: Full=Maximakinin-associated peptide; Flags: Precursor [Bombina maxima]CAD29346.1 kininogen-2 [Bombina maxima]
MRLWFCLSFFIVLCLEHFPGTLADERNNRDYTIRTRLHGHHKPSRNNRYAIKTSIHGHHIPRNVPESEEKTEQFLRDLPKINRKGPRPPGFSPFRGKFHSQSLRQIPGLGPLRG